MFLKHYCFTPYLCPIFSVPESGRTHYDSRIAIQPEGMRDFWDIYGYDRCDKGSTLDVDEIVDSLSRKLVRFVDGVEDYSAFEPYLQIIMDNNIGSIVYDW